MSLMVNLGIICIGFLVIGIIIAMVITKRVTETNALLWIVIGVVTIACGFFPDVIDKMAARVGVQYPPAFVFMLSIVVLLFIVFKNTIDISVLTGKVQELAMQVSLLNEENNHMIQSLEEYKHLSELTYTEVDPVKGKQKLPVDVD